MMHSNRTVIPILNFHIHKNNNIVFCKAQNVLYKNAVQRKKKKEIKHKDGYSIGFDTVRIPKKKNPYYYRIYKSQ